MKAEDLKNAVIFMERATATGPECFGWVQTYTALREELDAFAKREEAIEIDKRVRERFADLAASEGEQG